MGLRYDNRARLLPCLDGDAQLMRHPRTGNLYIYLPCTAGTGAVQYGTCSAVCTASVQAAGEVIVPPFGTTEYGFAVVEATSTVTADGVKVPGGTSCTAAGVASVTVHADVVQAGRLVAFVKGVKRTSILAVDSVDVSDQLNTRNTASFTLHVPNADGSKPVIGDRVDIFNGADCIFAGTIDTLVKEWKGPVGFLDYKVTAVDWNQLFDRFLIARVYAHRKLGYIIKNMVLSKLANEGIDLSLIADGPDIEKAVFNYQTVTDCLTELCELTGYAWWLDYSKVLHVVQRTEYAAPVAITEGVNAHIRAITLSQERGQYRNTQYVTVEHNLTTARVEKFRGDYSRRTFTCAYPIAKAPESVIVTSPNGVDVQTVGKRGVDSPTAYDWYYELDSPELSQNDDAQLYPALTPLDEIAVTYQGSYPSIIVRTDATAVSERQSVEGGSGVYENLETDSRIEDQTMGNAHADALLRKYGELATVLSFQTEINGLRSGQLLTVDLPTLGVYNEEYLITSVQTRDVGGQWAQYTVQACSGEHLGGWVQFFRNLLGVETSMYTRGFMTRDDTVLSEVLPLPDEAFSVTDALTVVSRTVEDSIVNVAHIELCEAL